MYKYLIVITMFSSFAGIGSAIFGEVYFAGLCWFIATISLITAIKEESNGKFYEDE